MEEWKHTILLLSGGKEGQMGEKCSVATEEAGMENDATFANWNLTVSTVSGRKIDIIMMHEDVELSASKRMARGPSPLIVSKQHSKNIHVFTCMIKCLERLPFDQEHQKNQLCIMLMDWIGKLAPLLCSISFHSQALFFLAMWEDSWYSSEGPKTFRRCPRRQLIYFYFLCWFEELA